MHQVPRLVSLEAEGTRELRPLPAPLCIITDRHRAAGPLPEVLSSAVRGGALWIRVREPDLELSAYTSLCHLLIDAVDNTRITWSVRPSAYLLMRSAWPELRLGVHLTSTDAPWGASDAETLLGRSVHMNAASFDEQVDYQLLAPVYNTRCKPDAVPTGPDAIMRLVNRTSTPVIALGGVTPGNTADCLSAGASGVAVCGGVMESESPEAAVAAYLRR